MHPPSGEFNLTRLERVIYGPGTIKTLGAEAERRGLSRVLVVTPLGGFPILEQVTGGHYDVLAEGQVVGHIMLSNAAPVATPWIWTLAYGFHDYRKRTRGYAATRDAALQAISESWQRE